MTQWRTAVPAGAELGERPYWDGGEVRRYAPDGELLAALPVPVSQPTCPAFGGPGLDELYLTSAWEGMAASQRAAEPLAGHGLHSRPGTRGMDVLAYGT
jgi:sugar lactone lactonase YvrE